MDFSSLFPDLQPWVRSLGSVWPATLIRSEAWLFPVIQTFHLLALGVLGGCVLLPGMRLMGAGLTPETPASIEKTMRPWLWAALIVLVISGVLMSLVIAQRLYTRPAFLIKMVAMSAALILSLGVVRSVASRDGAVTPAAKVMAAIALVIWLGAVFLFGTSRGAAPGAFHLVCAGWLIVMAFGSNITRIALGSITAIAVVAVGVVTYAVYHPFEEYDLVMEINRWAVRLGGALVAGFALWEFARPGKEETISPALARLVGLFTIMAWVTVAAAGRWIGLGGSG